MARTAVRKQHHRRHNLANVKHQETMTATHWLVFQKDEAVVRGMLF